MEVSTKVYVDTIADVGSGGESGARAGRRHRRQYEVRVQAEFVYVAADERFFLHGNLYDSNSRRNVTETSRQEDRLEVVDPIDPETLIVLAPADPKAGMASWTGIARAPETEHQGDRFRDLPRSAWTSRTQQPTLRSHTSIAGKTTCVGPWYRSNLADSQHPAKKWRSKAPSAERATKPQQEHSEARASKAGSLQCATQPSEPQLRTRTK